MVCHISGFMANPVASRYANDIQFNRRGTWGRQLWGSQRASSLAGLGSTGSGDFWLDNDPKGGVGPSGNGGPM